MIKEEKKIQDLASQILLWTQSTLIVNLRFIDSAINALKLKEYDGKIATDAKHLFFNPLYILKKYRSESNSINADYMHVLLHCIFRHYLTEDIKYPKLWDLACDITVESMISELSIPCLEVNRQAMQKNIIKQIKTELGQINAKKIY